MTDFTRGFRLHLRHGQVLDGAMFPSGRYLVIEDPEYGLASAAASEEDLLHGYPDARIEWPDVEGTARFFADLYDSAEADVSAVRQVAETWGTQLDRIAPLRELESALRAARAGRPEPSWQCARCEGLVPRTQRNLHEAACTR